MRYPVLCILTLMSLSLMAQTREDTENKIKKIMQDLAVPGVQITHIKNGKSTSYNLGEKKYGSGDRVTDSTIFQAASMSKVVFAYAALRLYDQGLFDLDRPLTAYYDYARLKGDPHIEEITARMCLNHTTGLPNWARDNPLRTAFKPGTSYRYSGEGFVYLERVLEHLTGKPLNQIIMEEVLVPLGMLHSSFLYQDSLHSRYATGHAGETGLVPSKLRKFRSANAAFTMLTTAEDYTIFVQKALLDGTGLKPETHKMMLQPSSSLKGTKEPQKEAFKHLNYGLGVLLQRNETGTAYIHTGSNSGRYLNVFIAYPDTKESLVVFTNGANGSTKFRGALLDLMLEPQTQWFLKR